MTQLVDVVNLDKYNPGYKDRNIIWIKVYMKMINGSYEFEMLHEIDKWRFIVFCMLQTQTKKPVPANPGYLNKKGMDFKARPLKVTVQSLLSAQLIEIIDVTDSHTNDQKSVKNSHVEKSILEQEKNRKEQEGEVRNAPPPICRGKLIIPRDSYDSLVQGYGQATIDYYIDKISDYCSAKGMTYKDYAAVVRQWIRRDKEEGRFKPKSDAARRMEELYGHKQYTSKK